MPVERKDYFSVVNILMLQRETDYGMESNEKFHCLPFPTFQLSVAAFPQQISSYKAKELFKDCQL